MDPTPNGRWTSPSCNVAIMERLGDVFELDGEGLRKALLELLKTKSVRFGKFTLASGKESDFFIDCKQSVLTGRGHVLAGALMLAAVATDFESARAVAGVELGGCPLASAVSMLSQTLQTERIRLDALYVRKERKGHGTGNLVEGKAGLPQGTPVVLLEDVVTSGGSSLKAVAALKEEGFDVLGVLALVDRNEGAKDAFAKSGIKLVKIFDRCDFEN